MFCTNTDCPDYLATGFHAEFRPGITVCPSCGAALAESLESRPVASPTRDEAGPDGDDDRSLWAVLDELELPCELEPVVETTSVEEALVIRSALDRAWIPSVVTPREGLVHGPGATDDAPTLREGLELVVLVPVDLADEAREQLEELGEG
jgi:hypothetical protein